MIDYEPLAAVTDGRAAQAHGRAATARGGARQRLLSLGARRRGGGARGVRRAPHMSSARSRQQPADRRRDRAARGDRDGRARSPTSSRSMSSTQAAASHPPRGDRATRHRRRARCAWSSPDVGGGFGYKGKHYPEEDDRRLGGAAAAAAGALGRHAQRKLRLRQPGPRPSHPRRAGARRRGPFPRAARGDRRQSRRLCLDLRRRHPERDLQRAVRGRLPHAGDLRAKRPACSPTRCRPMPIAAPDGRRPATCWSGSPTGRRTSSASTAPRSGGAISSRRGHAVQDADRADLRLRRLPEGLCARARDRRLRRLRQSAARRRPRSGKLRGFGIACYVESSGVAPSRFAGMLGARVGFFEAASIRVQPDGACARCSAPTITARATPPPSRRSSSSRLGMPVEQIEIIEGDTDQVPYGTGTFGSRSIAVGGSALDRAACKIVAKGKLIAAHLLEAAAGDIEFADGAFAVAGTDRARDVRARSRAPPTSPHNYPLETWSPGCRTPPSTIRRTSPSATAPTSASSRSIPTPARSSSIGYWAVDDIGTVINPMIVEGQIHGGHRAGLGQALLEHCVYDARRAARLRLVHGLRDRRAPTTCRDSSPSSTRASPAPTIRSAPRAAARPGAIGAPAAIVSAVLDALRAARRDRSRHAADAGAGVAQDQGGI